MSSRLIRGPRPYNIPHHRLHLRHAWGMQLWRPCAGRSSIAYGGCIRAGPSPRWRFHLHGRAIWCQSRCFALSRRLWVRFTALCCFGSPTISLLFRWPSSLLARRFNALMYRRLFEGVCACKDWWSWLQLASVCRLLLIGLWRFSTRPFQIPPWVVVVRWSWGWSVQEYGEAIAASARSPICSKLEAFTFVVPSATRSCARPSWTRALGDEAHCRAEQCYPNPAARRVCTLS
jgi:hypothetical protein